MSKPKTAQLTDHDNLWKLIWTLFFEEGVAYASPSLWEMIDWSRGIEFLEQELYEIKKTRFRGAKICDKLVKAWLKDGTELFLLVHVEIESNPKASFALRFFWYRVLILDKHKTERIYSIAVYTGNKSAHQVTEYSFKLLDNEVLFKFPAIKVWELEESELEASDSVFALMLLAQKYANQSSSDMEQRLAFRKKLFDLAQEKKIDKRKIWQALIFVRYMTTLPDKLENNYDEYVSKRMGKKSSAMTTLEDFKQADRIVAAYTGLSYFKTVEKFNAKMIKEAEKAKAKAKAEAEKAKAKAKAEAEKAKVETEKAKAKAKAEAEKAKVETEKAKAKLDTKAKELEAKAKGFDAKAKSLEKLAQQEAQKRLEMEANLHKTVLKCFHERKWSLEEIAEFFSIEIKQVEKILKNGSDKH